MLKLYRTITLFFLCLTVYAGAQTGFIENKGQYNSEALFEAQYQSRSIFLDKKGFTLLLHDEEKWAEMVEAYHDHDADGHKHKFKNNALRLHAIKYVFEGADFSKPVGSNTAKEYFNYYLGNDQSKWVHGAKKHYTVTFKNIYPKIDLEFQAIDQRFKYNYILHPGADINDIRLRIDGAEALDVQDENVTITTRFGKFSDIMPISYFVEGGEKKIIKLKYKEVNGIIGLEYLSNGIDAESGTTIVDPELVFSTYAGNSVDNFGFTATYDSHGNLYAGGIATGPSFGFPDGKYPVTAGAFDITYNGGQGREPANLACDIAISKYDHTGSTLLYATFLGGTDDEYPHSMVVDSNDQLIVFGTTYSFNFPTSASAPQKLKNGGTDLFVTKFTENGSAIIGSTYIGGTENDGLNQADATRYFYSDDYRGEVNIDSANRIYIASVTISDDFPISSKAYINSYGGNQDGVVVILDKDISTILYSTYYGGTGSDAVYSVDIAKDGRFYICGGSTTKSIQHNGGGLEHENHGGVADGFIAYAELDAPDYYIFRYTFIGTSKYDQVLQTEIDKYGNIWGVGQTDGGMSAIGDVYNNDNSGQFIVKLDHNLNNILLRNTYGSGRTLPDITINAFLVDECDKIFVSGWGGNIRREHQQSMLNMPITADALQATTDKNDFHLVVFRKDLKTLAYGTYFGGTQTDDHVDGGTSRFDKKGVIYQSVCGSCPPSGLSQVSDFPTTPGAYSEKNLSPRCSNVSFKLAFGNLNRAPELSEQTYNVTATDTLDFTYTIVDPDNDTLYAWVDYSADKFDNFLKKEAEYEGVSQLDAEFSFNPGCESIGDTLIFPVYSLDVGCPAAKDSTSFFKIIVEPPPLLPPPGVICLNFLDKDALRIEWEPTTPSRFFKEMRLYKIHPNGQKQLINTYFNQNGGSYTDADVIDPRDNNYTYYLEVINICDMVGPKSYDLSSVKEHEVPVSPTYLKTVTVEGKELRIEWLRSTEDDFGHYEIYKSRRDGTNGTEYLTSIYDIDSLYFYDKNVDVDNYSYCYQIRVSDDCGHLSVKSNIGCSIVIRGESLPFKFDLWWDDYIDWAAGVQDYELLRTIDTGSLKPIVRTDFQTRTYIDGDLDYDWGGYWYSVIAHEAAGSENATSRSNDIYLIQPPLLHVPNAFTANGDNLNDVFSWSDVFVLDFDMKIYNRWGEKVFETTDKNADWNGIYKDNGLKNSNVYIWVVKYTGWDRSAHFQRGTVTIMR